jgi:hypothetical protein
MPPCWRDWDEWVLASRSVLTGDKWGARLDEAVRSGPVVVHGSAGAGKTSLLAGLVKGRANRPGALFVPVAPQFGTGTLAGLMERVMERSGLVPARRSQYERGDDRGGWNEVLARLVEGVPERELLLVIDDVDRLEPLYGAHEWVWLPRQAPAGFRLVLSCESEHTAGEIARRMPGIQRMELCGQPVARPTFEEVLQESQLRFGRPAVAASLAPLLCTRMGMSVDELRAFAPEASQAAADLANAVRPFAQVYGDVLHLASDQYRRAAAEICFLSPADRAVVHGRLAAFFSDLGGERFLDEAVWQWTHAGDLSRVASLLCDPWFVENKYRLRDAGDVEDDYERALEVFFDAGTCGAAPFTPRLHPVAPPERLRQFAELFREHRDFLHEHAQRPGMFFQLACNHPRDADVRQAARAALPHAPASAVLMLQRELLAAPNDVKGWEERFTITRDHRRILSCGLHRGSINVWDAQTGALVHVLTRRDGDYFVCAATPAGERVLAGGGPGALYGSPDDYALHVWSLGAPSPTAAWRGHAGDITSAEVTPDGRWCLTAVRQAKARDIGTAARGDVRDRPVLVWDLLDGQSTAALDLDKGVDRLALGPDGRLLVVATSREPGEAGVAGSLLVVDRAGGQVLHEIAHAPDDICRCMAVSPDGRQIIWHVSNSMVEHHERHVLSIDDFSHSVTTEGERDNDLAITPDGCFLVAAGGGDWVRHVRIVDLETGEVCGLVPAPSDHLALRGHWFVSGAKDGDGKGDPIAIYDIAGLRRGAAVITAVRLFRHDTASLDEEVTAFCGWCGHHWAVGDVLLRRIRAAEAQLGRDQPPCMAQWRLGESSRAGLLDSCPSCHGSLRFNPFIVEPGGEHELR